MKILDYYPDLKPDTASKLNFLASTFAGLCFLVVATQLNSLSPIYITGLLLLGMIVDSATVPYVHSGVISRRYKQMKYSDLYLKVHVSPATAGYASMLIFIASLFTYRVNAFFYIFAMCWAIVYITGVYAYTQVTDP